MKTSDKGRELIKAFEGLRLEAYKCAAGVWTIGYGHTRGVNQGQKITQQQADDYLIEDLEIFENGVSRLVTVSLNQDQFDALVSFAFNLGIGALSKSTLLKKLNAGKYEEVGDEFLKWVMAGGKRRLGLVRRRKQEKNLFEGKL
jgi:lysozyme